MGLSVLIFKGALLINDKCLTISVIEASLRRKMFRVQTIEPKF